MQSIAEHQDAFGQLFGVARGSGRDPLGERERALHAASLARLCARVRAEDASDETLAQFSELAPDVLAGAEAQDLLTELSQRIGAWVCGAWSEQPVAHPLEQTGSPVSERLCGYDLDPDEVTGSAPELLSACTVKLRGLLGAHPELFAERQAAMQAGHLAFMAMLADRLGELSAKRPSRMLRGARNALPPGLPRWALRWHIHRAARRSVSEALSELWLQALTSTEPDPSKPGSAPARRRELLGAVQGWLERGGRGTWQARA